jgi:hypothetical protein
MHTQQIHTGETTQDIQNVNLPAAVDPKPTISMDDATDDDSFDGEVWPLLDSSADWGAGAFVSAVGDFEVEQNPLRKASTNPNFLDGGTSQETRAAMV